MFSEVKQQNKLSSSVNQATEGESDAEFLLEGLADGRIAGLITDAARLAVAKAMMYQAQQKQSPVEAENSTQNA